MRLNRGTWMLLGSSLLIIFGVLAFQKPIQTLLAPSSPTPIVQTILPHNLAEKATRFIIHQLNNQTQIEHIDGLWQVTDASVIDNTRETNDEFVDGVLSLMSTFKYTSAFESDNLAQFGLEDSQVSIMIQTDTQQYTVYLGKTNPDGDQVYIRLNDDETVYLMPTVFEFAMIVKLATEPPYRDITVEVTEEVNNRLLFPDIFGYQIAEFKIEDGRDGSFIRYTQGEAGTWIVDGTVVDTGREIDHAQAAVNVSQFLFLEVDPIEQQVRNSTTDIAILRLSMTTHDSQAYNMNVFTISDLGYVGILDDGTMSKGYILPTDTVNIFFDMIRQPPYTDGNG